MVTETGTSHEKVKGTLKEGAYFGEMALLNARVRRSASARALTYCNLFVLSRDVLKHIKREYPLLAAKVNQRLKVCYMLKHSTIITCIMPYPRIYIRHNVYFINNVCACIPLCVNVLFYRIL